MARLVVYCLTCPLVFSVYRPVTAAPPAAVQIEQAGHVVGSSLAVAGSYVYAGAPGSGLFTNLNVESGTSAYPTPFSDGDLPVSDVVRDDASHTLYVATDFGVLSGRNDGHGGWHTTEGMPRYEVMHLEIQPSNRVATCTSGGHCQRVLYAATHSQGIWRMKLGGGDH